jgi:hypothetical protein
MSISPIPVGTVFKWLLVAILARLVDRFDTDDTSLYASIDSFLNIVGPKLFTIRGRSRSKAGKSAFVPGSMNNFGPTIRRIKKESILANEATVCIEAIDQSGEHRYEQPFKHSPYHFFRS